MTAQGTTIENLTLRVGDEVRLGGDSTPRWWWKVQAVSEHFVACVHTVPFRKAGTLCYTVLDWRKGIRGPCNLMGQGYGDGSYSRADCEEMLTDFEHYDVFMAKLQAATGPIASEPTLEISHRNNVPLTILEVRYTASPVSGVSVDATTTGDSK